MEPSPDSPKVEKPKLHVRVQRAHALRNLAPGIRSLDLGGTREPQRELIEKQEKRPNSVCGFLVWEWP